MAENASEVARLRQRIADEYLAAKWGLTGLAYGTSQHQFITRRMENMGESVETLIDLVESPEEAAKILADTLEDLPQTPTRYTIVDILRCELGNTEETAQLIDYIQEMWKTIDLLGKRFGPERTRKIIDIPSSFLSEEERLVAEIEEET